MAIGSCESGIIALLISKRHIHGYKVPFTYTTNFLKVYSPIVLF
jgi:hypothetical protein